ncbi:hypothetical protein QYE76_043312 [Lolium multiflorum]|uniref:Arabidopsis retrotransposon Orf1 C-terminal domain-containing protein n=1 Tax=Lolium multiflorum TaxID=4521 RepID=A0AAD8TGW5_LOLMU|nr:hypothetical protein QYE76_043312 [Lolium multiflorum]
MGLAAAASLEGQHKDYLDACSEGSFTSKEVEARWDLLDRIEENAEGWENNKGYADKPPFKPLPPKEGNEEKEEKKKKKGTKKKKKENKEKEVTAYPRVNEITLGNRKYVAPNDYYDNESEYNDLPMPFTYISDHDLNEHTTFDIANLWETNSENDDDNNCHSISAIHASSHNDIESSKLGEEVFENPFATDHYVFDTSPSNNNDGQHKDYLDACSEGSFTSKEVEARWDLLDRIEENAEGWENNKGYADKPPFKPLPPKEGNEEKEEKKKKKGTKKKKKKKENKEKEVTAYPRVNEITLGNRKYVAPNDYYDNESEYNDLPMPFTYISDHDLNEHTTFDIANLWETNSENDDDNNCHSISAIHASSHNDIESSKLGEEVFENPFATDHYVFDTSPSNNNDGLLNDFLTLVDKAGLTAYMEDEREQYHMLTKIFVESFKFNNKHYHPTVTFKIYGNPVTMKLEDFCIALDIAPVGTAKRIEDNPRALLELYREITNDDCRTIQRGKIRNIQLPAIKYFAYYLATSILGRENTSNISSYHLAFLIAALTGETPYHLGALVARRLSNKGPIFGGIIASRILAYLDLPLDPTDVKLTPIRLDIAAMKSHQFVTTDSSLDNMVYRMLFSDGDEREIPLPQQDLFSIDRKPWSRSKEEVDEQLKIQGFHQQHDSEDAEPSYDYTVTYPGASSSTYPEYDPSSSYYGGATSWAPWD